MPSSDDDQAIISVGDAKLLSQMLREWLSKNRGGTSTQGSLANVGAAVQYGWITLSNSTSGMKPTPSSAASPYFWKYTAIVVGHPQDSALDPVGASVGGGFAFNGCEIHNTATAAMGEVIYPSASSKCGDIIGVKPISANYVGPILAELRWTWFESGDITDGYYAWWFSLPNAFILNEDKDDDTR